MSDIDLDKKMDARQMEVLANIAAERAKAAIDAGLSGYTDLQRHILCEVLNSIQITHRTIVTVHSDEKLTGHHRMSGQTYCIRGSSSDHAV